MKTFELRCGSGARLVRRSQITLLACRGYGLVPGVVARSLTCRIGPKCPGGRRRSPSRVHRRHCSRTDRGGIAAMALSYAVRRQLLEASLPESIEVRLELQDYLARTGMAPSDFARRINYARETVYQFLNGHYSRISSNDGLIRTAIRDFIAAHPIATPVISAGKLY